MNLHKLELYLGIFVSIHIYRILLTIRYKCFTFSYHALALTEVCINIEILKVEVKRFFPLSFDEKKNQSKSLWWMYFPLRKITATLNFWRCHWLTQWKIHSLSVEQKIIFSCQLDKKRFHLSKIYSCLDFVVNREKPLVLWTVLWSYSHLLSPPRNIVAIQKLYQGRLYLESTLI